MIPQTDSGFLQLLENQGNLQWKNGGQIPAWWTGISRRFWGLVVKHRQPLQQKPHKNICEMSDLLKAKNQSMRGNGRKQYQDSPTQKKKAMGPQPASQAAESHDKM